MSVQTSAQTAPNTCPVSPKPLDNGSCLSNADCPSDYPHCCQVGDSASCFEEACEDIGGTPKGLTAAPVAPAKAR